MNNYQNTVQNPDTNFDPYRESNFGQNMNIPYIENVGTITPPPMEGNVTSNILYPLETSTATPFLNVPVQGNPASNFAKGGKVKYKKGGLFGNPGKWLKSNLGGMGGAIIGNLIAPGIGGIIGGGLGNAAGSKIRGRKDWAQAGLRGAAMAAALPTAASLAGSGANALGLNNIGSTLSQYGSNNSILSALGIGNNVANTTARSLPTNILSNPLASALYQGTISPNSRMSVGSANNMSAIPTATNNTSMSTTPIDQNFIDMLAGNAKSYLSQPSNWLTAAVVGNSFFNRPKEKSPEQLAEEHKRYQNALMFSPQELNRMEANLLAQEQMKRRIARNKFLPEERLGNNEPLYVRTNTPEEYRRQGRWLNYFNNPNFEGQPIAMKKGGHVDKENFFEIDEMDYPQGEGYFLTGTTGGQDDDIKQRLSEGSYIIPADVVAHAGDGNSLAGARKINALVSNGEVRISPKGVQNLGKGNHNTGVKKLDNFIKNIRKYKGGKIGLPPKTQELKHYI